MVRAVLCAALVATFGGCDDEFPAETPLASVAGTVTYDGDAHLAIDRPAIQVAAFTSFPPTGPPHATVLIPDADFGGSTAFELKFLPAATYQIVAQVVDRDNQNDFSVPAGGFPDFCSLSGGPGVELAAGERIDDIDIAIFDNAGFDDPCAMASDVCPGVGNSSISLTVDSDIVAGDIQSEDDFVFGLFDGFPPAGPPVRFAVVTSGDIEFPMEVIDNTVPPGDYAVYACFDRGGDNNISLCDSGDDFAVHGGGTLVTFPANQVVQLQLDISSGSSGPVTVTDPADLGCP